MGPTPGDEVIFTAPDTPGETPIKIQISDNLGNLWSQVVTIEVVPKSEKLTEDESGTDENLNGPERSRQQTDSAGNSGDIGGGGSSSKASDASTGCTAGVQPKSGTSPTNTVIMLILMVGLFRARNAFHPER